jgi:hypothetical protein
MWTVCALSRPFVFIRVTRNSFPDSYLVKAFGESISQFTHSALCERRFGGLGESSDENLSDVLEPAAQVAEEIATKLTGR